MMRLREAPVAPSVSAGHGPRGRSRVDRTHMGWEGRKRTWLDPAWSSVLRTLALGKP